MKLIKWLLGIIVVLVLIVGVGIAAMVNLVDWNDYKETIQNQVKEQTGRDLEITGDLDPSFFPWAGLSVGKIAIANASGFGDSAFASITSADVKVNLLPLIKREINVRTVELKGVQLDLQRNADGTTNWDDLVQSATTTTTTTESGNTEVTKELEGSGPTIAALAVGGIQILDANVKWNDAMTGTDAALSNFNLTTGAIELEKPFDLNIDFTIASNSMDLNADIKGYGELMIDLEDQIYTVRGFTLNTDAKSGTLPNGELAVNFGANVIANLVEQTVDVSSLNLSILGIELNGTVNVTNVDTELNVAGQIGSNEFNPRELFAKLGIEAPVTADEAVLKTASLSLTLAATPGSAELNDLMIKLDDTTFSGKASLPNLAATMPPVRFDFNVDAIDLDRYLPPLVTVADGEAPADTTEAKTAEASDPDAPIELPTEMMRQLDIDGTFSVGSVKISNLTTKDIVVPLKAKGGKIALQDMQATLYEGKFDGTVGLDVTGDTPSYAMKMALAGIQAEPLLTDLMQKDGFLSGGGEFNTDIITSGNTVNAIKAGLNGNFNTAFADGSINGINIGYQIRRAKAALTGKSLPEEEGTVKTDFSSLSMSGVFTDGVMNSDDMDMRSPLLRLGGAGMVDLPSENVDYTLTTLITGSAQGQGGADLNSLKGVKLEIPIRGTFTELSDNFAGVILSGMKDNITGNLKNQAKALADQKAGELKAQAAEAADAAKAKAQEAASVAAEELKQKARDLKDEAIDKAKDRLKSLFK
ncbi:MAG: AsmA protein [Granulosicoccus sp.]|jgi:AsmA protein